jgi:hypothetical protein
VISGYYLAQDTKTKKYLLIGGQGKPGDQILTLSPKELIFDPMRGWSDDQVNEASAEVMAQYEKYMTNITALETRLRMDLDSAFRFYEEIKRSGYNLDEGRVAMWLMDKIEVVIFPERKTK